MKKVSEKQISKRLLVTALSVALLISVSGISAVAEEGQEPLIMVSMGDSYSSGEGIEPFYGQDDDISVKVTNPDWLAHRSEMSWSGMLKLPGVDKTMADHKDEYWYFVAASGAVTDNFKYIFEKEYDREGNKGHYILEPQLSIFDKLGENAVDYVTLTIGGNDVGFADIIQACVVGSRTLNIGGLEDKFDYTWDKYEAEGGIKDKIRDAYESVAEKAGSQAQIIVAGYPQLLSKDGSGVTISKSEAQLVNENVSKFNNALEKIVESCRGDGMNISFVSVEQGFKEHEAYSDDPYINSVIYFARSEDLKDMQITSAYSVHPNKNGAAVYADYVQTRINELEEMKKTENSEEGKELTDASEATEDEIEAEAKHFSGIVLKPEDVVLKMFDALQTGDYDTVAECLDPATEQQIDFLGGIVSKLAGVFTGESMSWGELLFEVAGATDVDVIECYSENLVVESNLDLINAFVPKIPGVRNLFCTEADVYVKYRYKFDNQYYTKEETCHVRRYEWSGWRVETK